MVLAKFVSAVDGVSKKDGITKWYRLEFIATTINGGAKIIQLFGTEKAFNEAKALNLKPMADVILNFGVNDNGFIVLNGVRASSAGSNVGGAN